MKNLKQVLLSNWRKMSDRLPIFYDQDEENPVSPPNMVDQQQQQSSDSVVGVNNIKTEPVSVVNEQPLTRPGTVASKFRSRSRSPGMTPSQQAIIVSDPWHTASPSGHAQYEELMAGSVPCPSCYGSGRIPKERESELVALIPVTDKRLKPRRTWLWVLIGVVLCMVASALLLFFLIPRSVDITSRGEPIEEVFIVDYEKRFRLKLNFLNYINITNRNYYNVRVTNASGNVINRFNPWTHDLIGTGFNRTGLSVHLQKQNAGLMMNYTVTLNGHTLNYCENEIAKFISLYVLMQFDVTVTFEYLNHREQDTLTTLQQVCCVPSGNCTSSATPYH